MKEVQISKKYKLLENGEIINILTNIVYTPPKRKTGYRISINCKEYAVHQLVMKYFGPKPPDDSYVITHINGNNYDNRIENLKWISHSEAKCTLPEGLRKCDFKTEKEYNCAMAKLHRERCKEYDNRKRRERYATDEEYRIKQQNKAKEYQKENLKVCKERQKKWKEENPEKYKAKQKKWKIKNREYESQRSVESHRKNPEAARRANEKYRQTHPIDFAISRKKYYNDHKDEINERRRKKKS